MNPTIETLLKSHPQSQQLLKALVKNTEQNATAAYFHNLLQNAQPDEIKYKEAIDTIAATYEKLKLRAEALRAEKRLATQQYDNHIKTIEATIETLEENLLELQYEDEELLQGNTRQIAYKKNPPKCEVFTDAENLPEEFQRIKVEPNKKAIADAWKRGENIPPGTAVTIKYKVSIKPRTN